MKVKSTDDSDDGDDDDDLFSTPISTPPNELETSQMEYLNYELNLNNLQLLNGNYNLENESLTNTTNTKYMFDKFNIKFNINILKTESIKHQNALIGINKPLINVNINCNLLKINIDFNKLTSLNKIVRNFSIKNTFRTKGAHRKGTLSRKHASQANKQLAQADSSFAYLCINACLDELDVQIYGTTKSAQDTVYSIAEFKLNKIKCEFMNYANMNMNVKFSIFSLLLIDALQIYGQDYQLLASSHQYASLVSDLNKDQKKIKQRENDLITINIDIEKVRKNFTEYLVNINFNKLDLILNLETINELIILFYSSYMNLELLDKQGDRHVHVDRVDDSQNPSTYLDHKLNINFRFDQLNLLLFYMNEQLSQAQKFALLTMDGAYLNLNINANQIFSRFYLNALNILDLSSSCQPDQHNIHKYIFGIGLDKQEQPNESVFEITYEYNRNVIDEVYSKVCIKMASMCYLHSPKFLYAFKLFLTNFKYFRDDLTQKVKSFALDLINKGKDYISSLNKKTETFPKATMDDKKRNIYIDYDINLHTPVIALPIFENSTELLIAHLGHIKINGDLNEYLSKSNTATASHTHTLNRTSENVFIYLNNMNLFTIDLLLEKPSQQSATDSSQNENFFIYLKPKYFSNIIDNINLSLHFEYSVQQKTFLRVFCKFLNFNNLTQIKLSKTQFEHVIKSFSNLSYDASDKTACQNREIENPVNTETTDDQSRAFDQTVFYSAIKDLKNEFDTSLINIEIKLLVEKLLIDFYADMDQKPTNFAQLSFNDFVLNVKKFEENLTHVYMSLKSVYLIDKLNERNSYLLIGVSNNTNKPKDNKKYKHASSFISHSLPSSNYDLNLFNMNGNLSASLPSNHQIERSSNLNMSTKSSVFDLCCPNTPPPSPSFNLFRSNSAPENDDDYHDKEENQLVCIKILLVDEKHENYEKVYMKCNRLVNIKFADLQLNIYAETWIYLLDLLGLGSNVYTEDDQQVLQSHVANKPLEQPKKANMSIEFEVKNFVFLLMSINKKPFCKFNIHNLLTLIESKADYIKLVGKLGYLTICDVSLNKGFYRNRFQTSGNEALNFEFFKYTANLSPTAKQIKYSYDIFLKIRANSVKYLHIQRFISELTNYFQQFNQLQDALSRMRASSIGNFEFLVH